MFHQYLPRIEVNFESLAEVAWIVGLTDNNRSAVDEKNPGVKGSELGSAFVDIPGIDFCFSLKFFISANTLSCKLNKNELDRSCV